jgi:O-antigen/teichoic acid export membrane protein
MQMGIIEAETATRRSSTRSSFSWVGEITRSHLREYGGTFATEFTVLISQLLVYKLAAHFLGSTGFSEYAVARRTISLIYPVPLLGMAVALPRYIAHATGAGQAPRSARYFGAAVWCMGCGLLLCVLLMNLFPGTFAYLFFAGRQYASLVLPLSILLTGLVLHALVYSYFRGKLEIGQANLLQIVNFGLVPLIAFLVFNGSVRAVLFSMAILTTIVACVTLTFTPLRHMAEGVIPEAKELLRYGVQRIPGDFGHMALFALPVTFVAHWRGVQEAGYVAFGISALNMIGAMFTPLGLILLPKASRMLAGGDHDELRKHVWQIAKITVLVSVSMTVLLEAFAGTLIDLYLGPNFSEAATVLRILVVAAVPYSLFAVLRNLVDAYHHNAVNALNLAIALFSFLAVSFAGKLFLWPAPQILVAFVFSVILLALLTCTEAVNILTSRAA